MKVSDRRIVIVADKEPTVEEIDVKMAQLKEHEQRSQTMAKFIAGHAVEVIYDNDPLNIRVCVGDNVFSCLREEYPSTEFVANVALAVFAGEHMSADSFNVKDFDAETMRRFDPTHSSWKQYASELEWLADHNFERQLTAAVNQPAPKKLLKVQP